MYIERVRSPCLSQPFTHPDLTLRAHLVYGAVCQSDGRHQGGQALRRTGGRLLAGGPTGAARMLLTTYTRNLADDLRRQLAGLEPGLPLTDKVGEPGVLVSGLDKVARVFLQRAGDEVATVAEQVLGRLFDHALVDEAQDLSPAHLQVLRALVEPGRDDLLFAEDSHQRIYGKKITLNHYGIHVRGRSRRLPRNYRTTRQNLADGQHEEGPETIAVLVRDRSLLYVTAIRSDAVRAAVREWVHSA